MYNIRKMYAFPVFGQFGTWAPWLESVHDYLVDTWKLDKDFGEKVAILLAYATDGGLNPRVTSGYRDGSKQKEMQARWDAGDRQGLRVRPATDSKHSNTSWMRGAALAVDIATNNDFRMAQLARAIGLGAGADFNTPDPVHYYKKG